MTVKGRKEGAEGREAFPFLLAREKFAGAASSRVCRPLLSIHAGARAHVDTPGDAELGYPFTASGPFLAAAPHATPRQPL